MTQQPPGSDAPSHPPAGDRTVRRGPPVEIAPEVLSAAGQAAATILERIASPRVIASGGRDDLPWVRVAPEHLVEVARRLRDHRDAQFDLLHLLFAVDYVEHMEVVYVLFAIAGRRKAMVKVHVPPDGASVPSVAGLWTAAGWYEREVHDLFGVTFPGNADLSPLLLYQGFEGYPGRKSFPFHEYKEF